jgi:RAB protein geranylgeranyltransferase component A
VDLFKSEDDFIRYSRRFNIDLAPKILFSKSESVDRLISSGVANYLEFNNVSENYFYNPEKSSEPSKNDKVKSSSDKENHISRI